MSYAVYYGLHGAAREDFPTAREALLRILNLYRSEAKYIDLADEQGNGIDDQELVRLVVAEAQG